MDTIVLFVRIAAVVAFVAALATRYSDRRNGRLTAASLLPTAPVLAGLGVLAAFGAPALYYAMIG